MNSTKSDEEGIAMFASTEELQEWTKKLIENYGDKKTIVAEKDPLVEQTIAELTRSHESLKSLLAQKDDEIATLEARLEQEEEVSRMYKDSLAKASLVVVDKNRTIETFRDVHEVLSTTITSLKAALNNERQIMANQKTEIEQLKKAQVLKDNNTVPVEKVKSMLTAVNTILTGGEVQTPFSLTLNNEHEPVVDELHVLLKNATAAREQLKHIEKGKEEAPMNAVAEDTEASVLRTALKAAARTIAELNHKLLQQKTDPALSKNIGEYLDQIDTLRQTNHTLRRDIENRDQKLKALEDIKKSNESIIEAFQEQIETLEDKLRRLETKINHARNTLGIDVRNFN